MQVILTKSKKNAKTFHFLINARKKLTDTHYKSMRYGKQHNAL